MKTIAQWNAANAKAYKPGSEWDSMLDGLNKPPRKPEVIGCRCECGGRILEEIGVYWSSRPFCQGVICEQCRRQGYIKSWMQGDEVVMVKPKKKSK